MSFSVKSETLKFNDKNPIAILNIFFIRIEDSIKQMLKRKTLFYILDMAVGVLKT